MVLDVTFTIAHLNPPRQNMDMLTTPISEAMRAMPLSSTTLFYKLLKTLRIYAVTIFSKSYKENIISVSLKFTLYPDRKSNINYLPNLHYCQ